MKDQPRPALKNRKPEANVRALAASILTQLLNQNGSLTSHLQPHKDRDDYPLLQEICFGTCRHYFSLEFILLRLLAKPLRAKDKDVKCLLMVGLYQLRHLSLPDYAVINETVSAVSALKKPWGRGLTNAVLRNFLRDKENLESNLMQASNDILWDQPSWLTDQLKTDWPSHWQQILEGSRLKPPMTLRVNLAKLSRSNYLKQLQEAGIEATQANLAFSAVYLAEPMSVDSLPGFPDGLVSIQDEASQLIPGLLQLEPDQRVLDACAAPGGKTCHILESEQSLTSMTAIDIAESRLGRIKENLSRLSLNANLLAADANDLPSWWDGKPFDRILLDAPCSASGVIRRHPDIKLLRTPSNLRQLYSIQRQLLENIWKCLKPNGLLLYTTCSVLAGENEAIVANFLESTNDAKYEGIAADWGVECPHGRQLLPAAADGPDGFFFSLIRKA